MFIAKRFASISPAIGLSSTPRCESKERKRGALYWVSKIEELFNIDELSVSALARMDGAIAAALQRRRPGAPRSPRQERRGYGLRSDIRLALPFGLSLIHLTFVPLSFRQPGQRASRRCSPVGLRAKVFIAPRLSYLARVP